MNYKTMKVPADVWRSIKLGAASDGVTMIEYLRSTDRALESASTRQRMALSNARRMIGPEAKTIPNWVICRNLFGLGRASATELCVELGVDPDGR